MAELNEIQGKLALVTGASSGFVLFLISYFLFLISYFLFFYFYFYLYIYIYILFLFYFLFLFFIFFFFSVYADSTACLVSEQRVPVGLPKMASTSP